MTDPSFLLLGLFLVLCVIASVVVILSLKEKPATSLNQTDVKKDVCVKSDDGIKLLTLRECIEYAAEHDKIFDTPAGGGQTFNDDTLPSGCMLYCDDDTCDYVYYNITATGVACGTIRKNDNNPHVMSGVADHDTINDVDVDMDAVCHPGDAVVHVRTVHPATRRATVRPVPMREVKVGDMAWNGTVYEPIVGFSKYHPDATLAYMELTTENGYTLHVTPHHYVFANGIETLPADVRPGDVFETMEGPSRVVRIGLAQKQGVYHPHTPSKTLYVNGVKTSVLSHEEGEDAWLKSSMSSLQSLLYKMTPASMHSVLYGYGGLEDLPWNAILADAKRTRTRDVAVA